MCFVVTLRGSTPNSALLHTQTHIHSEATTGMGLLNLPPLSLTLPPQLAIPTPPPAGPGNFGGKTLETHPNNRVFRRLTTDVPRPQVSLV
jgi:hypothetical protein